MSVGLSVYWYYSWLDRWFLRNSTEFRPFGAVAPNGQMTYTPLPPRRGPNVRLKPNIQALDPNS